MQTPERYVNERLDHLGVVAGVCEEIGLAAFLDRLASEINHHVSMGTATVAMILHSLGFSKRRLYAGGRSSLPTNRLSTCSGQEERRRTSTMMVWIGRWTGCTRRIPPRCLLTLPPGHARSVGECASCACGYDLVFREWGLRRRRGG
jgi:hypothetical protein